MAGRRFRFAASLPERAVRALAATLGGVVHESAQVLLPRLVRRSRLYEATAANALRIAIEAVGGVEPEVRHDLAAGEVVKRKAAGNVVELGSVAAFGFSPLWLLAAASDVLRGSRVYLDALVEELKAAAVLDPAVEVDSVDGLLAAVEGASGRTASLVDLPPVELAELRASLAEFRSDAAELPSAEELAALYRGLRATAAAERRPLLEVSQGIGLAFLLSARSVGRTHLALPYREDWAPLRREGFAAYARRVSRPYARAIAGHFDPARPTLTERVAARLRR
ncbi:MAG TPA: hypothetical protein VHF23_05580 [Gaiellaceae bacterium]|nr:hypothetical protein [Gaiellaceae bacterium]